MALAYWKRTRSDSPAVAARSVAISTWARLMVTPTTSTSLACASRTAGRPVPEPTSRTRPPGATSISAISMSVMRSAAPSMVVGASGPDQYPMCMLSPIRSTSMSANPS